MLKTILVKHVTKYQSNLYNQLYVFIAETTDKLDYSFPQSSSVNEGPFEYG